MKKHLLSFLFIVISFIAFSQITITSTVTNVSCFGGSNGSATVSATGGAGGYTYTWTPAFANSPIITGLAAGQYTVTVMDASMNTNSFQVTIGQPSQLTAVCSSTNSNCGQANGQSCVVVSGGTLPYNNLWNNSATTLCNSNIVAGLYTFTVTDANGCIANTSGLVNNIAGVAVSVSSQTNITCYGLCNGGATSSVTGGVAPYNYSWNNGAVTPSVTNICAGIYSLSVTDNAGCIGTVTVIITQPTQLTATVNVLNNPTCMNWCDGSANIIVSGGVSPYAYTWQNGANSSTATNLCPGVYQVTVTDPNGCSLTQTVVMTPPPNSINITTTVTNASCQNSCNGSISANVTGGAPAYTYTFLTSFWPNGIGGNTPNINAACPGSYTLIVTDAIGCQAASAMYVGVSSNNSLPNATVTSTSYNETCHLTGDGAIDISVTGNNPGPFTYLWSNGATTEDITNVTSNTYWISITDGGANCITIQDTITSIGTNCGTISGNVYIDNDANCINNTGDNNYQNVMISINPGNRLAYTNLNGDYTINDLPYGTYTINLITSNTAIFPTCTTTLTPTVNAGTQNSNNNNLSVAFNSITQPDLHVTSWNQGVVPGFNCRMWYYLNNLNNVNASGVFKTTLPTAFISNIIGASPALYSISGDTIIWNFNNISYFSGNGVYYIDFTTPLTTPLGSIFTSCMWAQATVTDLNYANNTFCYQRMVNGSFDPNDKTVSPVGFGANGDITATETDLTYLIRFQNTGNGPAVNIVVKDTLSPNVDINTFEMLSASHNYNIDILPGNVLRWKFNNIMLADSGSNEPASHGYIQYRIKRTNNNTPGTQIKNTAYIYFDFNAPVVTNTAINTIETITGIKSSSSNNAEWNVYPNPSTGVLYIVNRSSIKEESQIQVINSIGQTVLEETITSNYKNIDLSKLNNGVYFVRIVSDRQSVIKRVVLSR